MKTHFYWRCLFALVASAISIRRRIASREPVFIRPQVL
jgi:hypothetical protein